MSNMKSILHFLDAMEIIASKKELKKLDEYQRYNLAVEAMKSEMLADSSANIKISMDNLSYVLNDTPEHPFVSAFESIAESISDIMPGVLDVRLELENSETLSIDNDVSINIHEEFLNKEVVISTPELGIGSYRQGTIIGTDKSYALIKMKSDGSIIYSRFSKIKYLEAGDADVPTS